MDKDLEEPGEEKRYDHTFNGFFTPKKGWVVPLSEVIEYLKLQRENSRDNGIPMETLFHHMIKTLVTLKNQKPLPPPEDPKAMEN